MDRALRVHPDDPMHAWSTDELWSVAYDHEPTCTHRRADRRCVLPPDHNGDHAVWSEAKRALTGMRFTMQLLEV